MPWKEWQWLWDWDDMTLRQHAHPKSTPLDTYWRRKKGVIGESPVYSNVWCKGASLNCTEHPQLICFVTGTSGNLFLWRRVRRQKLYLHFVPPSRHESQQGGLESSSTEKLILLSTTCCQVIGKEKHWLCVAAGWDEESFLQSWLFTSFLLFVQEIRTVFLDHNISIL